MKKSALQTHVEYGLLRGACALVNALPYRFACALAKGIGIFAFDVLHFKRKRTLARIQGVFPEKSPSECRRIARQSLSNVLQIAIEMIRAPYLDRKWMDRYVISGLHYKDKLQSYLKDGRGAVVMVPHSGNWYMAAWSMSKYGIRLCAIAAKQRNPKIDAWMKRQYGDFDVVERGRAKTLVDIKSAILKGRVFAILPDLRVPQPDVEVGFLGGKANVSHAGAMFAVSCGVPLIVAAMRRTNGRHEFVHLGTLRPNPNAADKKAEAARLTRAAFELLDREVVAHPEQWFWYNKRWVLQPV
ncbi:MAG TPA: hypothetical protein DD637_02145 [Verrucomicrobia bacterium]|nr:hypothetical protein [Verrucomicrobiota bacterium]